VVGRQVVVGQQVVERWAVGRQVVVGQQVVERWAVGRQVVERWVVERQGRGRDYFF
jgi:hypothetical protein